MTEKLFTQDEVNQIVRERLAQEKEKTAAAIQQKEAELAAKYEQENAVRHAEIIRMREERRKSTLIHALEAGNAVNAVEISKILDKKVKTAEDGSIIFEGEDGQPVPVEEGVKSYLIKNPWAIKNTATGGAGSGGYRPMSGNPITNGETALRDAFGLLHND